MEQGLKECGKPLGPLPAFRVDLERVEDRIDILAAKFGELHTQVEKLVQASTPALPTPTKPASLSTSPCPSPPAPAPTTAATATPTAVPTPQPALPAQT